MSGGSGDVDPGNLFRVWNERSSQSNHRHLRTEFNYANKHHRERSKTYVKVNESNIWSSLRCQFMASLYPCHTHCIPVTPVLSPPSTVSSLSLFDFQFVTHHPPITQVSTSNIHHSCLLIVLRYFLCSRSEVQMCEGVELNSVNRSVRAGKQRVLRWRITCMSLSEPNRNIDQLLTSNPQKICM